MDDKCSKCNGRGSWEPTEEELIEDYKMMGIWDYENDKPKYVFSKCINNCLDCRKTGKESVRVQWEVDKKNPQKHKYVAYCPDYDECFECGLTKKEHVKN